MTKHLRAFAIAGLCLTLATSAVAQDTDGASLTLTAPARQADFIVDGAHWTCSGTTCQAASVDDMPALRSCKRVVAVVGAVTAFSWHGKALSDADIATCNTKARP